MSTLLENQTFKRKITYVRTDDHDKVVTFVITVQCNHEINKRILMEVDDTISDMLIEDYSNKDEIDEQKRLAREAEKKELALQKQKDKQELQIQKQKEKQEQELQALREKQDGKEVFPADFCTQKITNT